MCRVLAGTLLIAFLAACATTQQEKITGQNYCAFLGAETWAKLTANPAAGRFSTADVAGAGEVRADLGWLNPDAKWSQYTKVAIAPVTFWAGSDTKVSAADQQELTTFFKQKLEQELAKKFQVVDRPGPGVMTVEVALLDASTATPGLRSISMLVPQARALATLKYVATGTYPFVGSAQAEVRVTDSQTGQILMAAVDKRVGSGNVDAIAQWELGDAENAISAWAAQLTARLSSWTAGQA